MTQLRTTAEVAKQLKCSEWTVAQLVRKGKVECVRLSTTGQNGAIRFTDEQVAAIIDLLTVKTVTTPAPRKRRRRSA